MKKEYNYKRIGEKGTSRKGCKQKGMYGVKKVLVLWDF